MMIRHSQAYVFAVFLVGILLMGLTISVLMKPVSVTYNKVYNKTSVQDDIYQTFFMRTQTIWIWMPVLLGLIMIFWVLLKSHEKQNEGFG